MKENFEDEPPENKYFEIKKNKLKQNKAPAVVIIKISLKDKEVVASAIEAANKNLM
jgi:hypothetical protein